MSDKKRGSDELSELRRADAARPDPGAEALPVLRNDRRRAAPDVRGDGTPDFVQMATSTSHTQVEASYEINGKHYETLEEVPEEYRKLFPNVAPMAETAPASFGAAQRVAAQRVERTESRASWSPNELDRAASKPGWLKPFVLGMLTALLLGWLLLG
jgi:hypothetical protein